MKFLKFIIIFILAFLSTNCQESRNVKINYPEGDKILYSEYIGFDSQRLVLFSLEEQKEYEIPLNFIKGFPHNAKFSPDGKKILIKGPDYIDDIYIFDLTTSKWEEKILPALNHPGERDYFFYDYIDDSTVVFKGSYNLFIISITTTKFINKVAFNDTFNIIVFDINSSEDILYFNYGSWRAPLNNEPLNLLLYDYKKSEYIKHFANTPMLGQWIKSTDNLFMMDTIAILFNVKTGEKTPIKFENIDTDTIIFSNSRFIDENRFLIQMKGSDEFKNDFYVYDFRNKSLKQITNTKTLKTLMDIYIK